MQWLRRLMGERQSRSAQERLFAHLRAKEAELQTLTDAIPQLIWSADAHGRRDFCNARWFAYTGLTEAESYGDGWLSALHHDDIERVRALWLEASAAGTPYETEARLRRYDGEYRWFMARALPVYDDSGAVMRWLGTVTDIHHHRILEERQERAQRSLRVLADIGRALSEETMQSSMISRSLDILTRDLCDWAYVTTRSDAVYRVDGISVRDSAQRAFATLFAGMTMTTPHIPEQYAETLETLGVAATLSLPLTSAGSTIGTLYCGWRVAAENDERDSQLLAEIALRIASAVDRARVHESVVNTLQSVFTDQRLPRVSNVGFSAVYLPATKGVLIGGDWYDAVELPDGRIFIAIGDVGGHGIDAAIAMNRARQAMFASAAGLPEPAAVLERVHEVLEFTRSPMATALCGFLDPSTFLFSYASAGHSPPVLAREHGEAEFLPVDGAPLGIGFAPAARTFTLHVPPHALLVFYTDGLTEANRNLLSGERLLLDTVTAVRRNFTFAPAEAIRRYMLHDTETRDDVAILALSFGVPKVERTGELSQISAR